MLWGGEWSSLRRKVLTEPHQTLSSLPKEQQLNENMVASALRPIEVIHMREGKMEEEAEEEDEEEGNKEVRGERKRL